MLRILTQDLGICPVPHQSHASNDRGSKSCLCGMLPDLSRNGKHPTGDYVLIAVSHEATFHISSHS